MTRAREPGVRAAAAQAPRDEVDAAGGRDGRDARARGPDAPAARRSSPAASASASRWAARWCASRRRSCSTSRCRNLDAKLRTSMRAELARLHERLRHDDRLRHPRPGRGDDAGRPRRRPARRRAAAVRRRRRSCSGGPANLFVAAFIGSPAMNLVAAPCRRRARRVRGHVLPLPPSRRCGRAREVDPRRAPGAFALDGPRAEPELPRIEVVAEVVEELGDEVRVPFRGRRAAGRGRGGRAAAADDADEGRLLPTTAHPLHRAAGRPPRRAAGERVRLAVDTASCTSSTPRPARRWRGRGAGGSAGALVGPLPERSAGALSPLRDRSAGTLVGPRRTLSRRARRRAGRPAPEARRRRSPPARPRADPHARAREPGTCRAPRSATEPPASSRPAHRFERDHMRRRPTPMVVPTRIVLEPMPHEPLPDRVVQPLDRPLEHDHLRARPQRLPQALDRRSRSSTW